MRGLMYDGRGKMWQNENDNENENKLKRELIWVFLQKELKQDMMTKEYNKKYVKDLQEKQRNTLNMKI